MDKQIRMSASEVDLYKYIYHSNRLDHNDIALTESGLQSVNKLLGEIEKIEPTYPDKRWEFWFSVPRGTLKQYINSISITLPKIVPRKSSKKIWKKNSRGNAYGSKSASSTKTVTLWFFLTIPCLCAEARI